MAVAQVNEWYTRLTVLDDGVIAIDDAFAGISEPSMVSIEELDNEHHFWNRLASSLTRSDPSEAGGMMVDQQGLDRLSAVIYTSLFCAGTYPSGIDVIPLSPVPGKKVRVDSDRVAGAQLLRDQASARRHQSHQRATENSAPDMQLGGQNGEPGSGDGWW